MARPLALVTGASSGIGRELARLLAREGYDLVVVARRLKRLQELGFELRQTYGASVLPIQMDLREADAPDRILEHVMLSGLQIDVLINDAGLGRAGAFGAQP